MATSILHRVDRRRRSTSARCCWWAGRCRWPSGADAYGTYIGVLGSSAGPGGAGRPDGLRSSTTWPTACGTWSGTSGDGFKPRTADATAWLVIAFALVATLAVLGLRPPREPPVMTGYRTPLGRARGLGSAKHGVGHFIVQRVTARAGRPGALGVAERRSVSRAEAIDGAAPLAARADQRRRPRAHLVVAVHAHADRHAR